MEGFANIAAALVTWDLWRIDNACDAGPLSKEDWVRYAFNSRHSEWYTHARTIGQLILKGWGEEAPKDWFTNV